MPIKTIEAEAERGAEHARAFLADNPTYADIQTVREWSMADEALAETAPSTAYHESYRAVLRPHLI